jgi:hypothetical protein
MYVKAKLAMMTVLKNLKHLIVAAFEKLQHQKRLNVFGTKFPVTFISGLLQEVVGCVVSFIQL